MTPKIIKSLASGDSNIVNGRKSIESTTVNDISNLTPHSDGDGCYLTSDLPLAATLCCLGHQAIRVNRYDSKRVKFVFQNGNELSGIIERFWSGEIRVEPKSYFSSLK